MNGLVLERIRAWEAAGLVDGPTAAKLRAAEAATSTAADAEFAAAPTGDPAVATPPVAAKPSYFGTEDSVFGPGVSLVEMLSYVGGAFLLAAWSVFLARLIGEADAAVGRWLTVASLAIPAAVTFVLGVALHGGSPRRSRAAGVCFLLSTALITSGVALNLAILVELGEWDQTVAVGVGLLAAIGYRWLHPSLLTHFGFLAWGTGLVASLLGTITALVTPNQVFGDLAFDAGTAAVLVILSGIAWTVTAIGFGLVGLAESRSGSPASLRRAALTRFWAGVVLVGGVAYAVMRSYYDDNIGQTIRIVPPWLAVLIVVGLSAVLVERAIRREASAYVFAAALGLIIALTDLNVSYIAPTGGTEVALLVEGVLLVAAAFVAEWLRGRIGGGAPPALDSLIHEGTA